MAEEVIDGQAQAQEGGAVSEPQVGAEAVVETEEGVVTLPSDDKFVMPDKFTGKSAEEIARSYIELEKFKGEKPAEGGEETPPQTPEDKPQGNKYLDEYNAKGELSEESYKELEDQGVSRQDVDDKLEFETYKAKKNVDDLVSVIGGIENFTKMDTWSQENFTPEQVSEYAKELAGASKFGKQAILKDIYSQYNKALAGGEEPSGDIVHTNEGQGVVGRGYASQHELQADMSDPRYGTDRSYTKAVEEKLAKSKNF